MGTGVLAYYVLHLQSTVNCLRDMRFALATRVLSELTDLYYGGRQAQASIDAIRAAHIVSLHPVSLS